MIDSIRKTTLLDEKATIAQGNIVRQRDTLFAWYEEADRLIDSLWAQIGTHKRENATIRESFDALQQAYKEEQKQNIFLQDLSAIKEEKYEAELKNQRGKKWTWLGGGTLIGVLLMLLLGG